MNAQPDADTPPIASPTPFAGLAPWLALSLRGQPLDMPFREFFAQAGQDSENPVLWMQMALLMMSMNQREQGLMLQANALELSRLYTITAQQQPAACRVLLLMAPGDLTANMPLECLLHGMDIELLQWYCSPEQLLPAPLPAHDVLMVGMSESTANRPLLKALEPLLKTWQVPVLNPPAAIMHVGRVLASEKLQGLQGVRAALTLDCPRDTLLHVYPALPMPCIIRPVDSHAGTHLARLDNHHDLQNYLDRVEASAYYIAPYIDYRSHDGLFRKYRIALIQGQPYACHLAIGSHWIVHYVSAGMYEDAVKREEEAGFMQDFEHGFAARHAEAWDAIYRRTGLDYVCLDCAETMTGELLIFEIDHAMIVHAMDDPEKFAYKQAPMQQLRQAFRTMLLGCQS